MLPSTGYFKAINCPFYDNGYCERPYCHFRHSRRDGTSTSSAVSAETSQTISKPQATTSSTLAGAAGSNVLEQLVSEAVKKVLADQNLSDTEKIVNKVVDSLKPNLVPTVAPVAPPTTSKDIITQDPIVAQHLGLPILPTSSKSSHCTYNPTPISELRKRHLPINVYEQTRESKAVKRKSPDREKPWMDVIRNINIKESSKSKYNYTPSLYTQANSFGNDYDQAVYDPGDDISYLPEKKKKKKDSYHPKQKKRREEYVPRRPKVPLKDKQPLDDDPYDVLSELLQSTSSTTTTTNKSTDSHPTIVIDDDDDDDDYMPEEIKIEPKYSPETDDYSGVMTVTKEEVKTEPEFEEISEEVEVKTEIKSEPNSDNECSNESTNKEKTSLKEQESVKLKEDSSSKSSKPLEKSVKEEVKHSKSKDKEDSKFSKSKESDSKHSKSKEDDSKSSSKNKERDKDKARDKYKDKHSSKSSDKERSSSSSRSKDKSKDKERERSKDRHRSKDRSGSKDRSSSKDSSHRSKKDSKSDKEKVSSSKDGKKDSKEKSKHKSDEKSKSKSKSSSDSKSKSSSHKNSDSRGSHSSHKHSKSNEKALVEKTEESESEENEEKSDVEMKADSPEYEEFSPIYDEQLLEASDSEEVDDVEAECRRIFQEYEVTDHPKEVSSQAPIKTEVEEPEESVKKRVAHPSAASSLTKQVGPIQPLKRISNPQQRMYERWKMMREVAAEKAAEKVAAANKAVETITQRKLSTGSISNDDHQINGNGRIRIAQVPYAMSLALEKKKVMEQTAQVEKKTIAQNKKGTRVAHVPQVVPELLRPEPLQNLGTQKFPLNVRQFYVNAMQDICIQIYDNGDDAAQRAAREELACYEKCKAVNVYKNSCMLTVHRLRKEVDQKSETTSTYGTISHEAVLTGKVKGTFSVLKHQKSVGSFKGVLLYKKLVKWILTEQNLKDNGYPRPHPDGPKGRAKIYTSNMRGQSTLSKVPNERICCRCNKPFMVDKHGFAVRKENCIYHYARKFTFRGESKYMCCKQDGSSDGCCDATTHVWEYVDVNNLRGYVSTFDKGDTADEKQGVYALDCEMCYTTQGLELTRVTVVNDELQVVYETLVKPPHAIIDYNTRFSGICEADMKNVKTTLLDVQATFLSMFSSKTILAGHSLESDFKALKLIHDTVVDTSVMFPHKNGPPFKRALKNLCADHLQRIIQNDLGGHDSKEDASACMELIFWKVKEEAKL